MNVADTPDLLEEARRGDNEACARLIEENGGLIWSIVRRYYGRGVEPEDLYQLGCLGFVKAVRGFDPASIAHDLRTPITVMKGYTEYLSHNVPLGRISEDKLMDTIHNLSLATDQIGRAHV